MTAEIIIGVSVTLIGGAILFFCGFFYKKWKVSEMQRKLYWMKVDCMIYALRNVNHGIGPDFSKAYDAKLEEMMEEIEFVNNNN